MKKFVSLLLVCLAFGTFHGKAMERRVLTHKEYVRQGSKSLVQSKIPIKSKRLSKNRANIIISCDKSMPDSVQTAINVAIDMWESSIVATVPIYMQLSFEPLDSDIAMLTETVHYANMTSLGLLPDIQYPSAMLSQYRGKSMGSIESPDAVIVLNSDILWNCRFQTSDAVGYNIPTMVMRGIAIGLGFGSSIIEAEPDKYQFAMASPTCFDDKLFNGATCLSSLKEESQDMANFVTSDNVYVNANRKYKMFAPATYKPYTSLVYLDGNDALMSKSIGSGSLYLSLDETTLDIINEIGWESRNKDREIICNDITDNGIGSSYSSHTFSLLDDPGNISAYQWNFYIKRANQALLKVKSGTGRSFTIDPVTPNNDYFINANGDYEGLVECEYTQGGKRYSALPFHVSLELKPIIVSIDDIKIINEGYNFRVQFSVKYTGADALQICLEEETNLVSRYTTIEEPYIAHVITSRLTTFEYTWVTVIAKNKYGTAEHVLEFEPVDYGSSTGINHVPEDSLSCQNRGERHEIFTLDGVLVYDGPKTECRLMSLPRGMYIIRDYDEMQQCKTYKYIVK